MGNKQKKLGEVHCPSRLNSSLLIGRRILLVEDSEDNQFLIKHYLSLAGAEVHVASDGQQGLQKSRSVQFDLIIMDIQMPGIDGHEATRRLREEGFDKPIVALTAHALKEDRDLALACGASDYLTKPIDRFVLLKVLSESLH